MERTFFTSATRRRRAAPLFLAAFAAFGASLTAPLSGCGGGSSASSGNGGNTGGDNVGNTPSPAPALAGRIVFSSNSETGGSVSQVYTMNADGSSVTRLTNLTADELTGGWSRDGASIVFSSNRDNSGGLNSRDLYTMKGDGTDIQRLTNDNTRNSVDAAWSPAGNRIAFARGGALAVIDADGENDSDLTDPDAGGPANVASPTWAPDGSRIAFVADTPGTTATDGSDRSLFVVNANGSGRVRVTTGGEYIRRVAWAPNGDVLAFDSTRDTGGGVAGRRQIYRVGVDGTGRTRLTNDAANDLNPSWSPDGARVLFSSNVDYVGGRTPNFYDLYVIDRDGGNLGRITRGGRAPFVAPRGYKNP